jgi:hypothetical protein
MTSSYWVGPRWVGPRWFGSASGSAFGSGGFDRYEGDAPGDVLARALVAVREDLERAPASRRDIEPSPTRGTSLDPSQVFAAIASLQAQAAPVRSLDAHERLWRYDTGLRQSLIVEALTSRLNISFGLFDSTVSCGTQSHAGDHILVLDRPTEVMWRQESTAVMRAAQRRKDQADELLMQVDSVPVFFAALLGIGSTTHPNTLELMSVVAHVVGRVLHVVKHRFAVPRPHEVNLHIIPVVGTPAHYSFPAGHAAFAFAQSVTFGMLFDDTVVPDLFRLSQLISDNRVVAGLHYPMDSDGGFAVGVAVAAWLSSLHSSDGKPSRLATVKYGISNDQGTLTASQTAEHVLPECPEWSLLVEKAKQEWSRK